MESQIIVFNQKIADKWSISLYKRVLIFFVVPGSLPCDGVDHMAKDVGQCYTGDAQQQASKRRTNCVSHLFLLFLLRILTAASVHVSPSR